MFFVMITNSILQVCPAAAAAIGSLGCHWLRSRRTMDIVHIVRLEKQTSAIARIAIVSSRTRTKMCINLSSELVTPFCSKSGEKKHVFLKSLSVGFRPLVSRVRTIEVAGQML